MRKSLLLFTLLFTCGLNAQTLSLQESIDKTLNSHPDVQTFALKIKQSQKGYDSAFGDYLPQINLQAQYNITQTYVLPVNGVFNTVDDDGYNIGVFAKQKLWDFEKTSSNVAVSKVDEELSELSLKEVKALLAYKVKSLYLYMVVQKEAIDVREKDLQTKQAYYEQSLALVEEGLKTKADASRFLTAVYVAKDNLAITHSAYEKAKMSLSLYIDEEIEDDVELEAKTIRQEYDFSQNTLDEILQNNYTLQIDEKTIDKNMLIHKSAKASHYGSFDATASYNQIDTLSSYDTTQIGISLNIPLYSGGKTTAQEQKAQISTQIAKEQKASKILSLKDDINSLLLDIKRYNKTIEAKKASLESAKQTKEVLEGRYTEGLSTYIEVLDATSQVLGAELGVLETYYLKSMAINRIEYLKGKI